MYIMMVSRGYPSDKYKMNGLFEFDQAKALAKTGCKVVMLAIDLRSLRRWRKWGIETFVKDGVKIYSVNIPLGRVNKRLLHTVGRYALLKAFSLIKKAEGKPDIIHAHFIENAYYSSFLKDKYEIPFVITEHSYDVNQDTIASDISKMAERAYKKADKVIAVSNSLKNRISHAFACEPVVVENIVDTESFSLLKAADHDEKCNIITVGGLIPLKKMDLLIDAFYKAFNADKKVTLNIYGEGPELQRLQNKIMSYRLNECIFLRGLQKRSVIAEQMKNSSFFVLASESETFGVAYIEAIASGLPVIATDCGGPKEFMTKTNGLIIPVNNLEALTNALVYMREHWSQYNSTKISEEIISKYSEGAIAKKLTDVYKNVIDINN